MVERRRSSSKVLRGDRFYGDCDEIVRGQSFEREFTACYGDCKQKTGIAPALFSIEPVHKTARLDFFEKRAVYKIFGLGAFCFWNFVGEDLQRASDGLDGGYGTWRKYRFRYS